MDFDRLRAFVWTLEEGGISAAAKRLCRTQPAVTRMLQTLEDQVGAVLIDRKSRPLSATPAGLRLLEHARLILEAADRMTDGRVRAGNNRNVLRLGLSRSLLWRLRDPRFLHPPAPLRDTDFTVRSGWSPRLYRRFGRGEFDCAVLLMRTDWVPDVACQAEMVRRESLILIAPRGDSEPPAAEVDAAQLVDRSWILNPDGCGFRIALERLAESAERPIRVQFELDAAPHEHLAMVGAGLGSSIIPASTLAEYPQLASSVQRMTVPGGQFELGVWMLWSPRFESAPGTRDALALIFSGPGTAVVA